MVTAAPAAGSRALTAELLARLERHYIKPGQDLPGGIFLPEVTYERAGGPRADALYVGFTGTTGRLLIGHEVKVTRADWRRELDQPGKADTWADECHAWYVVAPTVDIVRPEELPHGWGLMTVNPRTTVRLDITVKAQVHPDRHPTWTACRSLLSRADMLRAHAIWEATQKARDAAQADIDSQVQARLHIALQRDDAGRLRQQLDGILDALGVHSIDDTDHGTWPGDDRLTLHDLRTAAGFIRAHRDVAAATRDLRNRYTDPVERTRQQLDKLRQILDELQALPTPHATAEEATA